MGRPVPGYIASDTDEDDTIEESYGWPQPRRRTQLDRWEPGPPSRRRSRLDSAWLVLALLGALVAAAAAVWYATLDRAPAKELQVPSVVGLTEPNAVNLLNRAGFTVRAVERPADATPGVVFAQRPRAQVVLARRSRVTIEVANGTRPRLPPP